MGRVAAVGFIGSAAGGSGGWSHPCNELQAAGYRSTAGWGSGWWGALAAGVVG